MIESLTPEQEQLMVDTRDRWIKIGRSTERINKEKAAVAIQELYRVFGYNKPQVHFFRSPQEAIIGFLCMELERPITLEDVKNNADIKSKFREQLSNYFSGGMWCAWKVFYDYCRKIGVEYPEKQNEILDCWMQEAEHCQFWFPYEDHAFASDRPTQLHIDENGRLDNFNGPALAYEDGFAVYCVHGVLVPDWIITNPEQITVQKIDDEGNAEVRRVMVDKYGQAKYVIDSGLKPLHSDDWGTLYQKPVQDDEAVTIVKVTNSTPEGVWVGESAYYNKGIRIVDEKLIANLQKLGEGEKYPEGITFQEGTHFIPELDEAGEVVYKDYFIRVQPQLRPLPTEHNNFQMGEPQEMTARNAVASTFGYRGEDYILAAQS